MKKETGNQVRISTYDLIFLVKMEVSSCPILHKKKKKKERKEKREKSVTKFFSVLIG